MHNVERFVVKLQHLSSSSTITFVGLALEYVDIYTYTYVYMYLFVDTYIQICTYI